MTDNKPTSQNALDALEQAFLEVCFNADREPNWYTHGRTGKEEHLRRFSRIGTDAIEALKHSSAEVVTVDELGFEIEDMLADISFTNDRQRHFADALADRFGERFPSGLKIIRSEK